MITLPDFIKQYDRKDAVVLLEGKRTVADADMEKPLNPDGCWRKKQSISCSGAEMPKVPTYLFQQASVPLTGT